QVEGDAPRREGDERRGRSRDRYGRDRRERAPREGREGEREAGVAATSMPVAAEAEVDTVAEVAVAEVAAGAPAPVAAPVSAPSPAASPSSRRPALPKVSAFDLPAAELARIAEGAGLQWVNSDAERVAAVRAAIDAEPRPIHVPRERPAVVVLDDGPLVLVETRKDLATLTLPFENQSGATGTPAP
ncbi:MAG: hypothetical protein REJ24_12950, partial [Rhodocyclaceae bacterium]|nr:hypothetical protein [Rhodocyclaceae bacterium]